MKGRGWRYKLIPAARGGAKTFLPRVLARRFSTTKFLLLISNGARRNNDSLLVKKFNWIK
jgi:hypothetical protein